MKILTGKKVFRTGPLKLFNMPGGVTRESRGTASGWGSYGGSGGGSRGGGSKGSPSPSGPTGPTPAQIKAAADKAAAKKAADEKAADEKAAAAEKVRLAKEAAAAEAKIKAEKQYKIALALRAKNAGLDEGATEDEVKAAEAEKNKIIKSVSNYGQRKKNKPRD